MNELIRDNIELFITLMSTLAAIVGGIAAIQRYFHTQKVERLVETHKIEIERLNSSVKKDAEKPLVQEEKVVYVKYLYIRRNSEPPVYKKYIKRIDETIDVHSEYRYFRLNKYSTKNNTITIRVDINWHC